MPDRNVPSRPPEPLSPSLLRDLADVLEHDALDPSIVDDDLDALRLLAVRDEVRARAYRAADATKGAA